MADFLTQPWPWYIGGPLIGLVVPLLLLYGGKSFGVSSNLRHMCAAALPGKVEFFQYDWKSAGLWNLTFILGTLLGGALVASFFANPDPIAISEATRGSLAALGITDFQGFMPDDLFSWSALLTVQGFVALVVGGFLVGFGTRWAGGCTSGHAITGLASFQLPSLIAVTGFFAGGLFVTHVVLPLLM